MHPNWRKICDEYIKATSYDPAEMEEGWKGRKYDNKNRPPTYLTYPDAKVRIPLGEPQFTPSTDLWKLLRNRRSKRNFLPIPLTFNELNILLWGMQGITADMGDYQLRTTPSSGALYPIETYLLVNRVDGLKQGLYHLDVKGWTLEGLKLEDVADISYKVSMEQELAKISAVNFVWTAVMERCRAKYYERAYRYIWWDVGHIAENLHIVGNAIGLGVCSVGAWYDSEANKYLGIDGVGHFSVLFASVGKVEGEDWKKDRRPPNK
ncbi:MAG: dehydrogenase [Planctomycetes bacterium RBG_16_43_13]|nr:MAG: dehydrogenase [Planctomycetes bacterium RBG_16_43_13]